MKKKIITGLIAFLSLMLVSNLSFGSGKDKNRSISPMLNFKNDRLEQLEETVIRHAKSKIKRYQDHIEFSINTRKLPPGSYTVWMMTFDNPQACSDSVCNEDDFLLDAFGPNRRLNRAQIEAAQVSGFWVTGGIAGHDGRAYFSETIYPGNLPGRILFGPSDGNNFENPIGAEIMFQVRYHGYSAWDMPEELGLQISTLMGYCDQFNQEHLNPKGLPVGCYEPQISMHFIENEMEDD